MNGVIFTPDRNVKRADYTGAFLPEARAFANVHDIPKKAIVAINIGKSKDEMRTDVIASIQKQHALQGKLETIAFFCHGWKTGLQLGLDMDSLEEFTLGLRDLVKRNVIVPLYACSAARDDDRRIDDDMDPDTIGGDGGFADTLRDCLCAYSWSIDNRVMAHVTAGHTTRNPWVRFFDGAGLPYGGTGGYWVIRPKGPLWRRWIRYLRGGDNRFGFPFQHVDVIRAEVLGG